MSSDIINGSCLSYQFSNRSGGADDIVILSTLEDGLVLCLELSYDGHGTELVASLRGFAEGQRIGDDCKFRLRRY